MYIQNSLPVSDVGTYDDDICEAVVCTIKSINTKVAAIYRPPDTNTQSFENLLKFLHLHLLSKLLVIWYVVKGRYKVALVLTHEI